MAEVAKRYQDHLPTIKKNVKQSYDYFKPNYDRYWLYKNLVFKTSVTKKDEDVLDDLGKPNIESNILEPYISRLMGEFAKQEPSIAVTTEDGQHVDGQMAETVQVVEGHIRHILYSANKDGCDYKVYEDLLSGGFSAFKVFTKYSNPMSFDQIIGMKRVYDPTLCGWDLLAQLPHKGDGRYCFENYPKGAADFKEEYPDVDITNLTYNKQTDGFNWSYNNGREDIIIICDYYEKKKKKVKIFELANGERVTEKQLKEAMGKFNEAKAIAQFPAIKRSRVTELEVICRYRCIENKVLEYVETDFRQLPLVFVDGNSKLLRETTQGAVEQMTRPYVYQAMGTQRLKNFAMQTLGNELENMVQHKWVFPEQALPTQPEYAEAITNNQLPKVVIYNAYSEDHPDQPVPPPREVMRPPIPPEIINTFSMADQTVQNILGAYDAALGINGNDLSGKAIIEGATNSNAAAMPYIVGILQALGQCAVMFVDLIPKYFITPRTIPIVGKDGKKGYVAINQPNGVDLSYDENALHVNVEPGVNFSVQKNRSLQTIFSAMQASPVFAQFINEECLEEILDNMELRGIDMMKAKAPAWQQKIKQMQAQQAQAQQQAAQNNPMAMRMQIEAAKLQHQVQQDEIKNQLAASQQKLDEISEQTERMKVLLAEQESQREALVRMAAQETEKMSKQVELSIAMVHEHHAQVSDHRDHNRDDLKLHHDMIQANKPQPTKDNANDVR